MRYPNTADAESDRNRVRLCALQKRCGIDVLEWLEAGLDAEIVVAKIKKIKRQNCGFDTSTEALKKLKASGVPNAVILAMVKA